jgi:hypothetical protein
MINFKHYSDVLTIIRQTESLMYRIVKKNPGRSYIL